MFCFFVVGVVFAGVGGGVGGGFSFYLFFITVLVIKQNCNEKNKLNIH